MRLSRQYSFTNWAARLVAAAIGTGMALSACTASAMEAGTATDPSAARAIQDPHYGDVLFLYFQDKYFSALTTLLASQQLQRVNHHADDAEMLRGGMLLSYGLHHAAGDIFQQLADKGGSATTRDRAWFFLAKIRYQRGFFSQAQDALARVGNALPADLNADRGLLQAQLHMARSDYASAVSVLNRLDRKSATAPYIDFNLGIAQIQSGNAAAGRAVLDAVGRSPAESEEMRSLRDRANLALGFSALASQQPKEAQMFLERIRLGGAAANKALLGFGWAAASQNQAQAALVPWQELAQRDVNDTAVLEAQIAIPYAYAELGAWGQSAQAYEDAIKVFARQGIALKESVAAVRAGNLVQAMLQTPSTAEMGWFWKPGALPAMAHAATLAPVVARHDFQEALKNYRDLRYLAQNITDWRDRLSVFDDMLTTRREAFAQRLPVTQARRSEIAITPLRNTQADLTDITERAAVQADGVLMANAGELALAARIARVQAALAALTPSSETMSTGEKVAMQERTRLAAGALTWNLSQNHTDRLWQAQRDLQAVALALQQSQRLDGALERAQQQEPKRLNDFSERIKAVTPTLSALVPRVEELSRLQLQAIENIAVNELERQQDRVQDYAHQARFALAQLVDKGTEASRASPPSKDTNRAPKP